MAVVGADASLSAFLRLFFVRGVPLLRPRPVVLETYFHIIGYIINDFFSNKSRNIRASENYKKKYYNI